MALRRARGKANQLSPFLINEELFIWQLAESFDPSPVIMDLDGSPFPGLGGKTNFGEKEAWFA
jgi:hypothetical protein